MTDQPRRQGLGGGCGGPAWRGLFAELGTSARISAHLHNRMRVLGLLP